MLKKEDALKFIKDLEQRGGSGVITDKNEKYLDISVIECNVSDQTLIELHREKKIKIVIEDITTISSRHYKIYPGLS